MNFGGIRPGQVKEKLARAAILHARTKSVAKRADIVLKMAGWKLDIAQTISRQQISEMGQRLARQMAAIGRFPPPARAESVEKQDAMLVVQLTRKRLHQDGFANASCSMNQQGTRVGEQRRNKVLQDRARYGRFDCGEGRLYRLEIAFIGNVERSEDVDPADDVVVLSAHAGAVAHQPAQNSPGEHG